MKWFKRNKILGETKESIDRVSREVSSFFGCEDYDFPVEIKNPKSHVKKLCSKMGVLHMDSLGAGKIIADISLYDRIIRISPDLDPNGAAFREALYHEMVHGYQFMNNQAMRSNYLHLHDLIDSLFGDKFNKWEEEHSMWSMLVDLSVDVKLHLESTAYSYDCLLAAKQGNAYFSKGVSYNLESEDFGEGCSLEKVFAEYTDLHASEDITENPILYSLLKASEAYKAAQSYAKEIFFDWEKTPEINIDLEKSGKGAVISVFYETVDYDKAEARVIDFFYNDTEGFIEEYMERMDKRFEIILDRFHKKYPHIMK